MRLDLDLPAQLVLDARLAQLVLEEDLERHDEVRLLLASEVDLAKLPVPQRLADVKVTERPLALRLLGLGRTLTAPQGRRWAGVRAGSQSARGMQCHRLRPALAVRRARGRVSDSGGRSSRQTPPGPPPCGHRPRLTALCASCLPTLSEDILSVTSRSPPSAMLALLRAAG